MNTFNSNPQTLAIHFGTPKRFLESVMPEFFPPHNWIGALLARHIVKGALLRANLLPTGEVGCTGDLCDCVMIAEVTDASAAIEVIKEELAASPFHFLYQIGVREGDGWRSVQPSPGARVNWLFDTERHDLAHVRLNQSFGDFCAKLETFCIQARARLAVAGDDERKSLEESIPVIEGIARQLRESIAPEPIEPGEDES